MVVTPDLATLTPNQAARRERVIEAAKRLAAEGGYEAVQMRDVAAHAHVALGTIYRYFSSKDHLLATAQLEWMREFRRRLAQRPPKGDTPAERLGDIARRAVRSQDRARKLAAAMVLALSSGDPSLLEIRHELGEVMREILRTGMEGVPPARQDGTSRVLAHVWQAALMSWVNQQAGAAHVANEIEFAAGLLLPSGDRHE